jgi:hypothetical protein
MCTMGTIASEWSTKPKVITYRKVIVIRANPDDYDPDFEAIFHRLVDLLDPSTAT